MNILFVLPFFGGNRGGFPDVVDLSQELQKRGHTVIALAATFGNDVSYEENQNVKVFRVKPLHYLSGFDYGISFPVVKLHKLLKEFHIDVVNGVMEFGTQTFSAILPSRLRKRPYVFTMQGAVLTSGSPYVDAMITAFDYTVARVVSLMSKKVIVLSGKLSSRAKKIGVSKEKIRVVPTTIRYKDKFNPRLFDSGEIKRKLGLDGKVVIGYSGRLVRLKGLVYLMHALGKLRKNANNIHLLVVGDGPERPMIESASRRLNIETTMIGWMERSAVPPYVSAMDIFVNPSLTEGLPLTVMEAMAMQKAVVATDVGGTSDLMRNNLNRFLVPPSNAEALAAAMKPLVFDPELRMNMGYTGRKIIEKYFDWDSIVSKTENVYEEALS